jgi:hypothetical protein
VYLGSLQYSLGLEGIYIPSYRIVSSRITSSRITSSRSAYSLAYLSLYRLRLSFRVNPDLYVHPGSLQCSLGLEGKCIA